MDVLWFNENLPFVRVPVSPVTVLHAVPFSSDPEPQYHLVKLYKATGNRCVNKDTKASKYEYKYVSTMWV